MTRVAVDLFLDRAKAAEGHPPKNPLSGSHTVSDERRPRKRGYPTRQLERTLKCGTRIQHGPYNTADIARIAKEAIEKNGLEWADEMESA